jgi:hypothetical protein
VAPYSNADAETFRNTYLKLLTDEEYDIRVAMARAVATFSASDQKVAFIFCYSTSFTIVEG